MRIRYRPRWPLLLTLILGVGALVALFGYTRTRPAGEAVPAHGGSYVEGVAGAPSRLNPLFAAFNEVDRDLSALLFSGLVRLGSKGDVLPDLAERWTEAPDGRTYVFQLRPGLLWHDGQPLDADDVLFTIGAIQDPDFRGDPDLANIFRRVEVTSPNPQTVVMRLEQPFAPFLAHATVGILPEHLLGQLDAEVLFATSFNQRPIGSGPFRLVELTPAGAVLEAFEAYHLEQPFIERLELRFFRDDAALLIALRNDEIDGALFRPGLDPEDIASFDNDASLVRRTLHSTAYSLVYLNQRFPPFRDVQVRQALQHGLDRNLIIEPALAGQGLALESPIVQGLWAHTPSASSYGFDYRRAEALLDGAGWRRAQGGRVKEGVSFQFALATSDDPRQLKVAQEIARQWGQLGLQVEVQVGGATQFVEEVLLSRRFDAALVSIDPGPDPDPYPFWHSSQVLGEGRNLSGFSNPLADQLLEEARLTTSEAERAASYRAFQELFAQEVPAVLLYTPTYQYVLPSRVQSVSPGLLFDLSARFADVHRWFVETKTAGDEGD